MGRIFQSGFEINTTGTSGEWTLFSGAATFQFSALAARTGSLGLRCIPVSGQLSNVSYIHSLSAATGKFCARFYLNIQSLPSASTCIASMHSSSPGSDGPGMIFLETNGAITLRRPDGSFTGVQIGSASPAMTLSTWYMVEFKTDSRNASGSCIVEARLNGVAFASSSTEAQLSSTRFGLGGNLLSEAVTGYELRYDDVALNDANGTQQTDYPGPGGIVHLQPAAAGDAFNFGTQVGGTAGTVNNYTRVNENPPNDATSYNASAIVGTEDFFLCTQPNLPATTVVNVVAVGARFANITAADATTAIRFEIKRESGDTIAQSNAIVRNSTGWATNATANPRTYPIILYADPDGLPWISDTIQSMQIGYIISTGGTNAIGVTNIWASVEYYTPVLHGDTRLMMGV